MASLGINVVFFASMMQLVVVYLVRECIDLGENRDQRLRSSGRAERGSRQETVIHCMVAPLNSHVYIFHISYSFCVVSHMARFWRIYTLSSYILHHHKHHQQPTYVFFGHIELAFLSAIGEELLLVLHDYQVFPAWLSTCTFGST